MRLLKSLARGLEALDYLVDQRRPVKLTELSAHLDVDKSNASHLLRTLLASGYVEQVDGRRYQPTEKMRHAPGPSLEDIIAYRDALHGTLVQLVDLTGECAHMAVLVGAQVFYLDKITSPLPLKVDHPIGSLAPLHCTALGKAFLAFGQAKLPDDLPGFTLKTIVQQKALATEIANTRARGYSIDDEEFTIGIRCVAIPFHDPAGQMVAAVGLSGPSVRIDDKRLSELGQLVVKFIENHKTGVNHALR